MNKITWTIFAVFAVGILAVLTIMAHSSDLDVSNVNTSAVQTASSKNGNIADHVYGKADSTVTLIEYGDYECPGCGTQHLKTKVILETYKDKIRFIFRNFPLTTIHANAKAAAGAAEAAGLQNKYWEMHNKVYENQSDWENLTGTDRTNKFVSYAKTLGLNTSKFTTDMASSAVNDKITYDLAIGGKDKIEGTPTFFLNGKQLDSTVWGDSTKLSAAIDALLK